MPENQLFLEFALPLDGTFETLAKATQQKKETGLGIFRLSLYTLRKEANPGMVYRGHAIYRSLLNQLFFGVRGGEGGETYIDKWNGVTPTPASPLKVGGMCYLELTCLIPASKGNGRGVRTMFLGWVVDCEVVGWRFSCWCDGGE